MISDAEARRLDALRSLNLLDTASSESFDRITRMAGRIFDLPIAAVSLTDSDRQWFKSRIGVEHQSIPRDKAPCAEVAESTGVLVVEDLLAHPRYTDCTLTRSGVRFYAGAPLVTRDGHCIGAMCVLGTVPRVVAGAEVDALKDLAAMVMAQIEMEHAFGRIDPISNLPNRTQFFDDLADLSQNMAKCQHRIAVLVDLIDVSLLNHVMRVMGPTSVDEMVRTSARNLKSLVGPTWNAYHVGTTQLAFIAPPGMTEAACVAKLAGMAGDVRRLGGPGIICNPVVGVAPFVVGETLPTDVLRTAQGAAQDARIHGCFSHVHCAQADIAFRRSFTLLRDFEAALEVPSDFSLVYQPRIDVASGLCVGVEALMRWDHPVLGPISPGEFIPLVEGTALAGPTTAWVMESAAAQAARWREAGLELTVSINVSSANLHDIRFADDVGALLERHGLPALAIEIEVTETAVMNDAEAAMAQLLKLRQAGIRLAIDDFGTGYSSLSYLQRLPVQVVKIDRSFVGHIDTDPRQLSLVTMMISMTKHLGHRVVAEGVERPEILDLLKSAGCNEVQGYLYAAPMPARDLERWLGEPTPTSVAA